LTKPLTPPRVAGIEKVKNAKRLYTRKILPQNKRTRGVTLGDLMAKSKVPTKAPSKPMPGKGKKGC